VRCSSSSSSNFSSSNFSNRTSAGGAGTTALVVGFSQACRMSIACVHAGSL
jgi:hypothetical protein